MQKVQKEIEKMSAEEAQEAMQARTHEVWHMGVKESQVLHWLRVKARG